MELSASSEHGGVDYRELNLLGISPAGLLDFSVNSNPFGPPARVLEALRGVDISRYPDRECLELRERLACANQVGVEQILVGNGTAELIFLVSQAYLHPGDAVLICGPTFGEYRRAARIAGACVQEVRAAPPAFEPPLAQILAAIQAMQPRLVFLCNPNNPTGQALGREEIDSILHACGPGSLLVLDEAYRAFLTGDFFGRPPGENCLVLRSMTKDFALAGLRLGYALASPELIEPLQLIQPAWSVNALAQAAGAAALAELDYYRSSLAELALLSSEFFLQIRERGYSLVDSQTHYAIIGLDQPAGAFRARLLQASILVRDCSSFGLPQFIRVSTRLPAEGQKLLNQLE
jgi:histidinol-phosphate aminotransferase